MYFPTFILGASFLGVAKAFTMSSTYDFASFTPIASPGTSPSVETSSPRLTLVDSDLPIPLNHATLSRDPRPTSSLTLDLTAPLNHATMSKKPSPTQTSHTNPATTAQPAETSGAAEEEENENPFANGLEKNLPALIAGAVILALLLLLIVYLLLKSRCSRVRNKRSREEIELEAQNNTQQPQPRKIPHFVDRLRTFWNLGVSKIM